MINDFADAQSGIAYQEQDRSKWTLTTSFQVTGGGYIYNTYSTLYLLYGGLRYQNNNFSLSGYIPVVAQNNSGFTQSGMMIIPTGIDQNGDGNMDGNMGEGGHGMGMMNSQSNNLIGQNLSNHMGISLGDFYLYGTYQILKEYNNWVDLFVNPNIKFPTASKIGTGKFDYGISVNIRKSIESFTILAEVGFLKFGDPSGINYKDPFIFGIGLGKFISRSGNSVLLYFISYTKVIDTFEPPRQVSLGFNFNVSQTIGLSLIGSKGLSDYSPDFSASGGLNFNL